MLIRKLSLLMIALASMPLLAMDMRNTAPLEYEATETTPLLANGVTSEPVSSSVVLTINENGQSSAESKKDKSRNDEEDDEGEDKNKKPLSLSAQLAIITAIAAPTIYLSQANPQSLLRHYMARALGDSVNSSLKNTKWYIKYGVLSLICATAFGIDMETGSMFLLGELGSTLLARPLTKELQKFLAGDEGKGKRNK